MRRWWVASLAVAAVLSLRPQTSSSAEPVDNDELVAGPEFQGLPDKSSHSGVFLDVIGTGSFSLEDGVMRWWRDQPGFDQRSYAQLRPDEFEFVAQLAQTPGEWQDDLRTTYRRRA